MPGPAAGERVAQAKSLLRMGFVVGSIAERVGLSKVTVYKIRAKMLLEGQIMAPCSCGMKGQHKGACKKPGAHSKFKKRYGEATAEGEAPEPYLNPLLAQVPGSSIPPPDKARLMAGR